MEITALIVALIIVAGAALSIALHKLSVAGGLTGAAIAWLLYKGIGTTGIIMLAAFFIAGTIATSIGASRKERIGMAEKNKGQRSAWQVLANGGVAGIAGLIAWINPDQLIIAQLMAAAALASAAADTMSSELGSIYGSRFYNILSFKKDRPGLDGVVSIEGTLFGIGGSALIMFIYIAGYGYSVHCWWILIAGTAGNLADSILGASLQRKGWLTNDMVNGLNTLIAAIVVFTPLLVFPL
jgi:uncharacterized protein (TIGR00297 family)